MSEHDFKITEFSTNINNIPRQCVRIEVDGHVIEASELDMAEQWDFMEMAGPQIENQAWVNTALLAFSVISVDGVPIPTGRRSREDIRQLLRRIGSRGLDALQAAFNADGPAVEIDLARAEGFQAGN